MKPSGGLMGWARAKRWAQVWVPLTRHPCHPRRREGVVFGGRFGPLTITPAALGTGIASEAR